MTAVNVERQNEIRNNYSNSIQKLLIGPGSENISKNDLREIIAENPSQRYISGILFPNNEIDRLSEISNSKDSLIDNQFEPNSLGFTFNAKNLKSSMILNIETATYKKQNNPKFDLDIDSFNAIKKEIQLSDLEMLEDIFEFDDSNQTISKKVEKLSNDEKEILKKFKELIPNSRYKKFINKFYSANVYGCYERQPILKKVEIDLSKQTFKQDINVEKDISFSVFVKKREIHSKTNLGNQTFAITAVIRNTGKIPLFQSKIQIHNQMGMDFCPFEDAQRTDTQMNEFDMLYRNKKTFAVGHGTSVMWYPENSNEIDYIESTYFPNYEILPMSFEISGLSKKILDVETYAVSDPTEIINNLNLFTMKYQKWISQLENRVESIESCYRDIAKSNIKKCKSCLNRMRKSIKFLNENNNAMEAFQYSMNAMLLQRMKGHKEKEFAYKNKDYSPTKTKFIWRPFQLAFILSSLESTLNEQSSERNDLDLIWVPTGGGKTEAYLFSIAITIFYNKLRNNELDGVNVLMRYTLRLLTSQQFDRASRLIVAAEYIRRNNSEKLGKKEISIGLWIGESTCNKRENAIEVLNNMFKNSKLKDILKKNKFQILTCPWCLEENSIIPDEDHLRESQIGYYAIKETDSDMYCITDDCPFSDKNDSNLPIYVIDESVYFKRPSLLFGTVDKFAQVPLQEKALALFGSKDNRPKLVIQDELHLISGPLGSIVGAYEAAFDFIMKSNDNGVQPKYIASTATIKNADQQVRAIFDREVFQFPPSGLDSSDSFFVKEDTTQHGRKYYGVMPTGKTQTTSEVRLISLMLQMVKTNCLNIEEEELLWTITGYFNSIRELGKASSLISDDVREYCDQISKRNGYIKRIVNTDGSGTEELTSRIDGTQIPEKLKRLGTVHAEKNDQSVDILIASNMLSVGIDINRINNMFVVGQPKQTSEYIQATSRVGRENLGSVYTLYNSTRSRDKSHYETLLSYHKNMYKFVETSSVTPYSIPSLKKTVPAMIVAMMRCTISNLAGDTSAGNIIDYKLELDEAKNYLLRRLKQSEDKYQLYRENGKKIINEFIHDWMNIAEDNEGTISYYKKGNSQNNQGSYLLKAYNTKDLEIQYQVLNSMRTVENNCQMEII